ncbi:TIGR02270 family protein [Archangium violaceum]|uniref:TIGR02270 family protein n=1 Tax=Archangium violaceum Cb vi76 TaxID=1406225 RepID=A0A084SRB4_9BACT|nr:TIGR02270 family protein [Archangium violaceum]KFA90999.1 hypothetical protein Q664_25120 [Archangium violaceum Cb vi76]
MGLREDLLPRWDIFEEHLDEAAFLWARRERCLVSPEYSLEETGREEERLLAHMEELAEGGKMVAGRLVEPSLEGDEPERISVATYALLAQSGADAYPRVLKALEEGDEARHAAIQRTLELWEGPERAEQLKPLLTSPLPGLRALAFEVSAFHGEAPNTSLLAGSVMDGDVRTRVAALRCVRFLPEPYRAGFVPAALVATAPAVRLAGIELGLQCGAHAAWSACLSLAQSSSAERARAWLLLALGGGEKELEPVLRGLEEAGSRAQALWALGFSGRVAAADACLGAMQEGPAPNSALAAEAFSAITGLRLEGRYVGAPPAEDEPLPPLEEEELDADLVPKPEEQLTPPAVDAITEWWRSARQHFDPRGRYLRGQPFAARTLLLALQHESMRRRHVLALELALRSGGTLWIQPRGRVARQRKQLLGADGSTPRISVQTFDKKS